MSPKSGIKTSEAWALFVAQGLSGSAALGAIPCPDGQCSGWVQLAGMIGSLVLPVVYGWLRLKLKEIESRNAAAATMAASIKPGSLRDGEVPLTQPGLQASIQAAIDRLAADAAAKPKP